MRLIPAKQILSPWSDGRGWFGSNYTINLYKGCSHGCIYCDSRSDCYRVENFDEVRSKTDALQILEDELSRKRRRGLVAAGAMSDPYNPLEQTHRLTRGSLALLCRYGFGASVLTKSDLVVRDLDLFQRIRQQAPAVVKFSITTWDDDLSFMIEPHAPGSDRRFAALKEASAAGLYTGINLWPVLPFITDTEENVRRVVDRAAACGARFVCPSPHFCVTLRQNQRIYYYQQLDKLFPGLRRRYVHTFGRQYECRSPQSDYLWEVLQSRCQEHGLLCTMEDISAAITNQWPQQLTLF